MFSCVASLNFEKIAGPKLQYWKSGLESLTSAAEELVLVPGSSLDGPTQSKGCAIWVRSLEWK